jgi:hypothetical protein
MKAIRNTETDLLRRQDLLDLFSTLDENFLGSAQSGKGKPVEKVVFFQILKRIKLSRPVFEISGIAAIPTFS